MVTIFTMDYTDKSVRSGGQHGVPLWNRTTGARFGYQDFAAPVFVFNAVWHSLQSGEEEPVHPFHL